MRPLSHVVMPASKPASNPTAVARHLGLVALVSLFTACASPPLGPRVEQAPQIYRVLLVTIGNPQLAQTLVRAMEAGLAAKPGPTKAELDVLQVPDLPSVTRELKKLQIQPGRYKALFVDSITWARAAQLLLPDQPIIFNGVSDPVGRCVVDSLQKPGRNATGYMHYLYGDSSKRLEAMKLAFPDLREVLVLVDDANVLSPGCDGQSAYWTEPQPEPCAAGPRAADAYVNRRMSTDAVSRHAAAIGLQATFVVMCELDDLHRLSKWGSSRPAAAWQVPWQDRFDRNRQRLVTELNASGLPAIYPHHGYTRVGGLMSFAAIADTDLDQPSVQSLVQVILGQAPATLPVQMPRGFTFTINARTAEASALRPSVSALRVADTILH